MVKVKVMTRYCCSPNELNLIVEADYSVQLTSCIALLHRRSLLLSIVVPEISQIVLNKVHCKKCETNLQNVSNQAEISASNTKCMSMCIVSGESPENLYCIVTQSALLFAHHPLIPRAMRERGQQARLTKKERDLGSIQLLNVQIL